MLHGIVAHTTSCRGIRPLRPLPLPLAAPADTAAPIRAVAGWWHARPPRPPDVLGTCDGRREARQPAPSCTHLNDTRAKAQGGREAARRPGQSNQQPGRRGRRGARALQGSGKVSCRCAAQHVGSSQLEAEPEEQTERGARGPRLGLCMQQTSLPERGHHKRTRLEAPQASLAATITCLSLRPEAQSTALLPPRAASRLSPTAAAAAQEPSCGRSDDRTVVPPAAGSSRRPSQRCNQRPGARHPPPPSSSCPLRACMEGERFGDAARHALMRVQSASTQVLTARRHYHADLPRPHSSRSAPGLCTHVIGRPRRSQGCRGGGRGWSMHVGWVVTACVEAKDDVYRI